MLAGYLERYAAWGRQLMKRWLFNLVAAVMRELRQIEVLRTVPRRKRPGRLMVDSAAKIICTRGRPPATLSQTPP
jgi:hypothetical protein